jgi:class 3 adenylate cyclase/DNA-binding SARP family transcriptional activator
MSRTGNLRFEFRVLGAFEVVSGGRVLEIGSAKQRALLALLLTRLNRSVSIDVIGEELWEGRPPASLGATVQSLVYRIRKLLGADAEAAGVALRGRGSGYVLEGEELQVDAHRFERLAARGRELATTGASDAAARAFRDALGLWRGPALDGLAELGFARLEAARLEEVRLLAVEGLAEAELARGRHQEALSLLEPHVAANPLREAAWGQLMVTLYRLGRQAESLRAYQELRRILGEELGLEPNPALRQLESRILAQSPELGGPASPEPTKADGAQPEPPPSTTPPSEASEGALTIVMFTDVEGSTDLRSRCGDEAAQKLLRRHEEIVRALIAEHGGREVKALGDGFLATFPSARRALVCAAGIQSAFEAERWAVPGEALRLRIGLNAGEVVEERGDVFGQAVHAAARVAAKAKGGQILVSELVRRLVDPAPELNFRDAGRFRLRGFSERWRLFELIWADNRPTDSVVRTTRTPLVGRDAELSELRAALREAVSGSGRLVMLAGEPGIGKTRLTEELAAEALRSRALVFVGRCLEAEGAPPYAPFVEILESALAQAPSPEAFRLAAGDAAPEIARLVPRLRRLFPDIGPALTLPPEQERRHLFNSIVDMTASTARTVPMVYVLEDLHWADEASLLLLDHLAGHVVELPLLIVGTYRDVELDMRPNLARTLDGLVRQRLVRQVHVARLEEPALAEMLGALAGQEPPEAIVDLLFKETDGNPFFIEEVFRHFAEEGRLLDSAGRFRSDAEIGQLDVPENVRLVVGRRLDRLSEETRQVLSTAAVVGRSFRYELLEAAAGLGGDRTLDAVDEAERSHLVVATPGRTGGEEFGFVHELVRQTLLIRLSAPRRRRLHVAVADAMERVLGRAAQGHAADLVHHLVEAGAAADPEKTLSYLLLAGHGAMAASAFEDGLRHFERALALATEAGDQERADLLSDLGRARRAVGDLDGALEAWGQAIQAYEVLGDTETRGRVCHEAAWQLGWAARWGESIEMAQRGLQALEGSASVRRAQLLGLLAALLGAGGFESSARAALDEALALTTEIGDDYALGHVLSGQTCYQFCYLGHPAAATTGLQAAELLRATGDVVQAAMTLGWTVVSLVHAGRWEEAARVGEQLAPLADRMGHHAARVMATRAEGMLGFFEHGDLDELERFALRDLDLNQTTGLGWGGMALTWLGLVEFLRGNWEAAPLRLREGVAQEPPGVLDGTGWAFLFEQLAYAGDRGEARAILEEKRGALPQPGQPATWGVWQLLFSVIEGLVMLGDRDEAAAYYPQVQEALGTGSVLGNYQDGRLLHRVAGIAAAAGSQWKEAEEHFETALGQADGLPHRLEQLQTRRFYGQMLLERDDPGDRDRAVALVTEAAAGYRSLGMPRHADIAEALLTT